MAALEAADTFVFTEDARIDAIEDGLAMIETRADLGRYLMHSQVVRLRDPHNPFVSFEGRARIEAAIAGTMTRLGLTTGDHHQ